MIHSVKYLVLHESVLVAGMTLGPRLDPKVKSGIKIEWDDDRQVIIISHGKEQHFSPLSNVKMLTVGEPEVVKVDPLAAQKAVVEDLNVRKKITAQVSTPHGHVFDGPGAGRTK